MKHLTLILCLYVAMVCSATSAAAQTQDPERKPTEEEIAEALPPLMRAAWNGRVEEVRRLLKEGANVNETISLLGYTPLLFAAERGHLDVIKVLLDAGADPNGVADMGHPRVIISPLITAMSRRNKKRLETIDMLIAAGAKVNSSTALQSPLGNALSNRDVEMIRAFLDRGADVNWPEDEFGRTALVTAILAVQDGSGPDVRVVQLLLDAGANPNKPRIWAGDHCVSILEYLIGWSRTPDQAQLETRRLLVQHGAKIYRRKAGVDGCYPSR